MKRKNAKPYRKRADRADYLLAIEAGYDSRYRLHKLFGYKTDNYNCINYLISCGLVREITKGKIMGHRKLAIRCRFTKNMDRFEMQRIIARCGNGQKPR